MTIEWEDGHRSEYPGELLRWACPCAECRGEMGSPGRLDSAADLAPAEEQLQEAGLVGQYALMLGFESGHSTGIYTFPYLRRLCPCAACSAEAAGNQPEGGGAG